jgi:BlaI family transcriptional regulator, penicillinase repressor
MPDPSLARLGRRERQIMEVVYRLGRASVADVLAALPDPPSYTSVRTMLRLLEEKGHLRHREEGRRFVYLPVVAAGTARRSALKNLLATFFNGSVEKAVATLIESEAGRLSEQELDRLAKLIDQARKEGR